MSFIYEAESTFTPVITLWKQSSLRPATAAPSASIFEFQPATKYRPCHGSGDRSLAAYHRGPESIPGQSIWDVWWT